ncbi:toll-like receptor Tollo [Diadema antillarum]|uniref:toll-like receptor Tollo n=1 Tax=Diadema antillarum TaxID=105358 RepID=UPI003A83731F
MFLRIVLSTVFAVASLCSRGAVLTPINGTRYPYDIECPTVPLFNGENVCDCDPPIISVVDDASTTTFEGSTCYVTAESTNPENPNRFHFPKSRTLIVKCHYNSLYYRNFMRGVAEDIGDVVEFVYDLECDMISPVNLTRDIYGGFKSLRSLFLSSDTIQSIEPGAFETLVRLEELTIILSSLRSIPSGAFRGLRTVSTMSFYHNDLVELSDDIFEDIPQLRVISFIENNLASISERVFRPLVFVTEILLDNNNISSIHSEAFSSMRELETLGLSYNRIDETADLRRVFAKEIDLSHNAIKTILDKFLPPFYEMSSINLSNNKIATISDRALERSEFHHLKSVDLSHNFLTSVPPNLLRWSVTLEEIDLSHNSLESLPEGLFNISTNPVGESRAKQSALAVRLGGNPFRCDCRLLWFRLQDNPAVWVADRDDIFCNATDDDSAEISLFDVSSDHFRCPLDCHPECQCYQSLPRVDSSYDEGQIVTVSCNSKHFTKIPFNLPTNVSKYDLSGNSFSVLSPLMFTQRLSVISELRLTSCNISRIESATFLNLAPLQFLYLDGNDIHRLENDTFAGLINLQQLHLNSSKISVVEGGALKVMTSLRFLYLHDNMFIRLPPVQPLLSRLEILTLHGNPLQCSCDLVWFQGWLITGHANKVTTANDLVCYKKDTSLVTIREVDLEIECKNDVSDPLRVSLSALGSTLFVFLLAVACIVLYKKRKPYFQLFLINYFPSTADNDDDDKEFDAFISYSQQDDEFVLRYMVPLLEDKQQQPLSVCLHHRHFLPGECIAANIVRAVARSRRIVLVLSENFLLSEWCMYEFRMAHLQALQERTNSILIVKLGNFSRESIDPALDAHLRSTTYLDSNDPAFEAKLLVALKRACHRRTGRTSHHPLHPSRTTHDVGGGHENVTNESCLTV